jgi:regulator of nonsense transcripts 1
VASDILSVFDHGGPIGISPGYSAAGELISLAIADDKICRIVEFFSAKTRNANHRKSPTTTIKPPVLKALKKLQDHVLCRTTGDIFGFDMGPLTMSLYWDLGGLRITNAVDIHSAFSAVDRKALTVIKAALGTTSAIRIDEINIADVFSNPIYDFNDKHRITDLAQRAWVSQYLARSRNGAEMFKKVPRIDTKKFGSGVSHSWSPSLKLLRHAQQVIL